MFQLHLIRKTSLFSKTFYRSQGREPAPPGGSSTLQLYSGLLFRSRGERAGLGETLKRFLTNSAGLGETLECFRAGGSSLGET